MTYSCMSFNILGVDEAGSELYAPSEIRAEYIAQFLNEKKADIVGIQEAGSHHRLYDWISGFTEKALSYGFYSVAKIDDDREFAETTTSFSDKKVPLSAGLMILYRKDRFDLIERGAHRYSSTEKQERYFQWVHLRDKENGKDLFVTNTHWSIDWDENGKVSKEAGAQHRTRQANELRTFWHDTVGDNILFATGDYNCRHDSEWIQLAEQDVYQDAEAVSGMPREAGDIDHIFINPQLVTVEDMRFLNGEMDTDAIGGRHAAMYFWFCGQKKNATLRLDRMSDHDPLLLTVSVP